MDLEILKQIDADLARLEVLSAKAPILTYRPNPNQAPFHASQAPGRICTGSNRSGKTAGSIVEAISCALGERLWVPEAEPHRYVHLGSGKRMPVPNVGRIFAEEFKTIEEVILPAWREWCPPGLIKQIRKGQRGYGERIDLVNGSTVFLRVYQQEVESQEGSKSHWAMFDEPPPYDLFIAVRRGLLDYHGVWWMALTPLSEPWIWDILVAKSGPQKSVEHFSYSIYNNGPPFGPMTQAAIDAFIADLDEAEYEARILGNPKYLVGRVFPEWKPESPYYIPPARIAPFLERYCLIDPHPRKPFAVLWVAYDREYDIATAYDELFDPKLRTIEDVADAIFDKEYKHKKSYDDFERTSVTIKQRIIDSSSEELERGTGVSIRSELAKHGIKTVKAWKRNKYAGYDLIHDALKLSPRTKRPSLQVFTTCPTVCSNFLKHLWDEWATGAARDAKGQRQDAKLKDDDMIACLRYFYQRGYASDAPVVLQRKPYTNTGSPIPGLWAGV